MERLLLACQTLEAELQNLLPTGIELRVLDQGLHRSPDQLRQRLQREIDTARADEILLAYGLCGNGILGISSGRARLVVPRVDDCIPLLLGSAVRYREELQREPGTYWLSLGWIQHGTDPFREYQRCREKYGEHTARWIAHEMMKGYRRLVLIDTGACPLTRIRPYAREFARFFALRYEEMSGSSTLLRALLAPATDSSGFVVLEPGQSLSADKFLPGLGVANR